MPIVHAVPCTSVILPAHKPSLPQRIVINPVKSRAPPFAAFLLALLLRSRKRNGQIPFILLPGIFLPPISRTPPRPRSRHHFAAHSSQINSHRLLVPQSHPHRLRGPDHTQSRHNSALPVYFSAFRLSLSLPPALLLRTDKPLHEKALRPMA